MKRKYWVLLICVVFIVALDQYTKYEVQQRIHLHQSIKVINGFFNLTHLRNTGGAFGILGGQKGGISSLFFLILPLAAVGIILYLIYKLKEHERILSLSLSLILSGAIGNLIDRIRYREVVDFLDFYLFSYHWPAFNIADSAITIGIGLMILELLIHDRKGSTKQQAPNPK
ncbi:MAG: signal peptidase II [Deltaproteobacteria bacterium]|nr:signal peptidase II [Deltaproteobacteria bacterium]MBM4322027.1 signal peptidase II [Deltaproteobacteria bacterium]